MKRRFTILIFLLSVISAKAQVNNALQIEAGDDYVQLPADIFSSVADFTIEAWIYADEYDQGHVFNFGNNVNDYVSFKNYVSFVDGMQFSISVGGIKYDVNSMARLTSNIWHHIAITHNSLDGTTTFYLDGEIVGSEIIPYSFDDLGPTANNFLGRSQNGSETHWHGSIDEFRFWTRVKTQQEVRDQMFMELAGNEADLLVYYDFNTGTGNGTNTDLTTLYDVTSNAYHGTLFNFGLGDNGARYSNWIISNYLDLVSWHPFTEGFVDDQVAGHGGAISGNLVQATDRFGFSGVGAGAVTFGGGTVETDLILEDNQAFTVAAWVYWDGSLGFNNIVSFYDGSINGRTMLSINGDNGGEIRFGDTWPETGVFINSNEWVHIIATFDGNSTARIYLHGYEHASKNDVTEYNFKQTTPGFYIGSLEGTSEFFSGEIDDVRVYNTDILRDIYPIQGNLSFWSWPAGLGGVQLRFEGLTSGVNSFRLERSTSPDSGFVEIASLNGWENQYYEDGLELSTEYWYRLFAIGEDGTELYWNRAERTYADPYSTRYEKLWEANGSGDDYGYYVDTDSAGNIYFAGIYNEDMGFNGFNFQESVDGGAIYLYKMDRDFNVFWAKDIQPTQSASIWALEVAKDGTVYMTGSFTGDLDFAGEINTSNVEGQTMYFLKLDKDGNEIWNKTGDTPPVSFGLGLDTREDGYVYLAYEAYGDVTFAGTTYPANGPMLLKYDTTGAEIWAINNPTDDNGWTNDVIADGNGNIYTATVFAGMIDLGGVTHTSNGGFDILLAKYDQDQNLEWSQSFGGEYTDRFPSMALDSAGNLFVSGYFSSTDMTLDGTTIFNSNPGGTDFFLAKFDDAGALQWVQYGGAQFADRIYGIDSDGSNVYVAGRKSILPVDFGGTIVSNGSMFVAAYTNDGNLQWVDVVEGDATARNVAYHNNTLYVTGDYEYSYNSNGKAWGNYDWDNNDVFFGQISSLVPDGGAPVITMRDTPLYVSSSEASTIRFDVTDDSDLSEITIWFSAISVIPENFNQSYYQNWDVNDEGNDTYYIDVFGNSVPDPIGLQYYVSATDVLGNTTTTSLYYMYRNYDQDDGNVVDHIFPASDRNNLQESDFHIFSVTTEGRTVSNVFGGNSSEYAVFNYNGSTANQLSGSSALEIGKGYWMIFTSQANIGQNYGGTRPQVNNENWYQVNLNSGWTQIGNPYPFEINWGAVLDFNVYMGTIPDNHGISGFFTHQGAFNDTGYGSIDQSMGGFVSSPEAYTIYFPMLGNITALGFRTHSRLGKMPLDAEEWKVNINLENQVTSYNVAAIGMKPEATSDYDMYDIDPLPYLNAYLEFNSRTDDNMVVSQSYVKTADGYIWDFDASTSYEAGASKLTWDNSTFGENDRQLYLFDVAGNRVVNMREQNEYSFTLNESHPFKVLFGNQAFIDQHLKSDEVSVTRAYPNPFKDVVNIPFSLPEGSYSVHTQVFNQLGSLVTTIDLPGLSQGVYEIQWDGTNQVGQDMNEGLYYYKIRVEGNGQEQDFKGKIMLRR